MWRAQETVDGEWEVPQPCRGSHRFPISAERVVATTIAWDMPEVLEHNRQRRLAGVTRALRDFEHRYEVASEALDEALATGRLTETDDVCD